MSIQVPEDLEVRLRERAATQGMTVDELATIELGKLFASTRRRTLGGKGVLYAGDEVPRARDLKKYIRDEGEMDDA